MEEVERIVFEGLGEASMCWSERPTGIFDSEHAKQIGEVIVQAIQEHIQALEQLARDQHTYLLEIAPHSYQESKRAAHLREQWQASGLGEA